MKAMTTLTLIVCHCFFSFSQPLVSSRKFETLKKSVPLAIINDQPDCFHVLRYNKLVHDFTIERRAKPSAEITGFAPLKLDSINNSWFDYEKLDYLFFEQKKSLYFLFEKVLNNKRTLYLKIIDSLYKSSGFIELARLEAEKTILDFSFEFKTTADHNILIITSQVYYNTVKKTVMHYNIYKRKIDWVKKLPLENAGTGFSQAFECNGTGDLFYMLTKSRVVSYSRKYMHHQQLDVPVFFHDTLSLVSYLNSNPVMLHKKAVIANISHLNGVSISAIDSAVLLQVHYAFDVKDSKDKNIFFLNQKWSKDLSEEIYAVATPLNDSLKAMLTFYDGTDSKIAGDKQYDFSAKYVGDGHLYYVAERCDENYYKELIAFEVDLHNGITKNQYLIPRKIMVFKGRTRLKRIGEAMPVFHKDRLSFIILESPANFKKSSAHFNFSKFKKENNLWGSNVVMYSTKKDGSLDKKLIYHNSNFDLAPLKYAGKGTEDMVFYLSSGKYEQFVILKLNLF